MTYDKRKTEGDGDAFALALRRRDEAEDANRENRIEQKDDLAFAAGQQWPENIIQQRKADGRPCLTLSRILQYVHQVTGDIRKSPPALSVVPVDDQADVRTAKVYSGIIRNIERDSDAQAAYTNAAEGAAICGEGHFRLLSEYEDDETANQKLVVRAIRDHMSVEWDPFAVDKNKDDARYCFVYTRMPLDEFKAEYPDAAVDSFESDKTENSNYLENWWDGENVVVAEYWWIENQTSRIAYYQDGRKLKLDDADEEVAEQAAKDAKRVRTIKKRVVKSVLMTGAEFLCEPVVWPGRRIPIFTVAGEEISIADRIVRFGLVRPLKDPQRSYNYMRSAGVEAMALAPKAPLTGTPDMIKGFESVYAQALTSNVAFLPYNPDPKAPGMRPERVMPPTPALGVAQEALSSIEDMHAATGIYPASLGMRSNETSGKAILAREKQGDTGTYLYVDNLASAIKAMGKEIVYLIPTFYDAARTVRILGESGDAGQAELNVPMPEGGTGIVLRQPDKPPELLPGFDLGRYDADVKVGPSFQTQREEARESILAFVQAIPQAGAVTADLIAKNMDWPGAEEMAERLKPPDPGSQPPDPKLQAAQIKAEADTQKIAVEQQIAQLTAQVEMMRLQFEAQKIEFEREKMGFEAQKMRHELTMKNADMSANGVGIGEDGQVGASAPMQMVAQGMAALAQSIAQMAAMQSAPKRIVYDETGNAVGVEPMVMQ